MAVYYFYKICSLDNEYIYIGSTIDFKKRMQKHKSNCNTPNSKKFNYKLYKTIREHNGFENFIFDIIESINTDDKLIVLKREQELMIKYNSNLNMIRSFVSDIEKKQQKYNTELTTKKKFVRRKMKNIYVLVVAYIHTDIENDIQNHLNINKLKNNKLLIIQLII